MKHLIHNLKLYISAGNSNFIRVEGCYLDILNPETFGNAIIINEQSSMYSENNHLSTYKCHAKNNDENITEDDIKLKDKYKRKRKLALISLFPSKAS